MRLMVSSFASTYLPQGLSFHRGAHRSAFSVGDGGSARFCPLALPTPPASSSTHSARWFTKPSWPDLSRFSLPRWRSSDGLLADDCGQRVEQAGADADGVDVYHAVVAPLLQHLRGHGGPVRGARARELLLLVEPVLVVRRLRRNSDAAAAPIRRTSAPDRNSTAGAAVPGTRPVAAPREHAATGPTLNINAMPRLNRL